MTKALRFISSVIAASGALLILDATVTLLWQEPMSAWLAGRQQRTLERELAGLERRWADRSLTRTPTRPAAAIPQPKPGEAFGRIELPTLGRRFAIVEGTDPGTLRKGPGHYPESSLPGEGGTVAVAGHRTTYLAPFRTIDELAAGDEVLLRMPYGRFRYRVERTRIVPPDALWVLRRVRYERLVLTACHPLYSAESRIVVFARLVASGLPARE